MAHRHTPNKFFNDHPITIRPKRARFQCSSIGRASETQGITIKFIVAGIKVSLSSHIFYQRPEETTKPSRPQLNIYVK